MKTNCLTLDKIASEPWDTAEFLREFDLLVAVNELASIRTGATLYNAEFNAFLGKRLFIVDCGFSPNFLGVVSITPNPAEPWREVDDAVSSTLAGVPRGAWAVFRAADGSGYDAYMSDGHGDVCTETGCKFWRRSAQHPDFMFASVYAHCWGHAAYYRRNEIRAEIYATTVADAAVPVGAEVRDKRIGGKQWDRVVYEGPEVDSGASVHRVRLTRRGARTHIGRLAHESFAAVFNLPPAMPPQYRDDDNGDRLSPAMRAAAECAGASVAA